jgi:predicted nucleotide-binding protein
MELYHIIVRYTLNGKSMAYRRINLSRRILKGNYVEPYKKNLSMYIRGRLIEHAQIEELLIFKSQTKLNAEYVLPNGKRLTEATNDELIKMFCENRVKGITFSNEAFLIPREEKAVVKKSRKTISKSKIFIVHGREHEPVKELKTILMELGLDPIVLHEQASGGSLTLVEKLEKYAGEVDYAFIILTPEDVGVHKEEIRNKYGAEQHLKRVFGVVGKQVIDEILEDFEPRARQNVIFEMGYFFAKLKRKNVCCLLKGKMKNPSDIDGVEYKHFKESINEIKPKIIKELEEVGYI